MLKWMGNGVGRDREEWITTEGSSFGSSKSIK